MEQAQKEQEAEFSADHEEIKDEDFDPFDLRSSTSSDYDFNFAKLKKLSSRDKVIEESFHSNGQLVKVVHINEIMMYEEAHDKFLNFAHIVLTLAKELPQNKALKEWTVPRRMTDFYQRFQQELLLGRQYTLKEWYEVFFKAIVAGSDYSEFGNMLLRRIQNMKRRKTLGYKGPLRVPFVLSKISKDKMAFVAADFKAEMMANAEEELVYDGDP